MLTYLCMFEMISKSVISPWIVVKLLMFLAFGLHECVHEHNLFWFLTKNNDTQCSTMSWI